MTVLLNPYRFAVGGTFDPETDITWHSLFWAGGTAMTALAYANTDPVGTWPNETAEKDVTATGAPRPLFASSVAALNSQPAVLFDGDDTYLQSATFTSAPSYASGVTVVVVADSSGATASGNELLFDSLDVSTEMWFRRSNGGSACRMNAGSSLSGGVWQAEAHMLRCLFNGASSAFKLSADAAVTGNTGTETATGLTIGNSFLIGSTSWAGHIAFLAIYEGDLTADGAWADFQTWVTDTYGITL